MRAGRDDAHRPGLGSWPTVFRGSLTRDGGPTLRERATASGGSPDPADAWPAMLCGYARLQADLTPHAADLLSLGLADLRPASVPGQFEKLLGTPHIEAVVGAPGGITHGQYERLRGLGPQLRELCAELDGLGIPASLDHADVHPGNIFAASGIPFDWGDAAVAHPFSSLLVALRTAVEHLGCRRDPRSWASSPPATLVPGMRKGTRRRPSTAHCRWRSGLPRSPAP